MLCRVCLCVCACECVSVCVRWRPPGRVKTHFLFPTMRWEGQHQWCLLMCPPPHLPSLYYQLSLWENSPVFSFSAILRWFTDELNLNITKKIEIRFTRSSNEMIGRPFLLTVKAIMLELSETRLAHLLLHKCADMYEKERSCQLSVFRSLWWKNGCLLMGLFSLHGPGHADTTTHAHTHPHAHTCTHSH